MQLWPLPTGDTISHLCLILFSKGTQQKKQDENVTLKLKLLNKVCAPPPPSMASTRVGRGYAKVRISKPDTLSNCFMWSRGYVVPRGAHAATLCTRFLKRAEWKKPPRSGTRQCSAEFALQKSSDVVSPRFKREHHKNTLLKLRLRRPKPTAQGVGLLSNKQINVRNPRAEN